MATEWTILALLRAEVEGRIQALTPHGHKDKPFRPLSDEHRQSGVERHLSPRSFVAGRPERVTSDSPEEFGTSNREPSFNVPIRIVYPTFPENWRDAAMSDAGQIRQDIDNHAATMPSGVQQRFILGEPVFEAVADDPWETMTLTLFARLNAEG